MKEDARTRTPIEQLLREDPEAAREFLDTAYAVDIATFLEELPLQTAEAQLLSLPLARQTAVFRYMKPVAQVGLAQRLERGQLAQIVSAMNADDRTDLFNRLSPEQQEALLPGLAQAAREDIRRLAGHAEGTAGALMTSDYVALRSEITVREALDVLRREAPDKETIYRAYVIDDDRRLVASVRLRDLILAQPETRVSEVMISETLAVGLEDSQEDVARKIARYDVIAVPVVDSDGRLVGIVTHDDALDALQEEATEDFHRIGTVGKLSESVRNASMRTLYRKRIFWLALLIVGNLFSGAGIAYFEETISSHVGLLFFLPLLIGSSGNAGSQSATLMVRAIATGDVVMRDWGRLLGRELFVALALGLTLALAVSAIGLLRGGVDIALVVSLTMVLVVLVGSLIGLSLPFLLDRMKLDPATASAPLVTTIADAVGVVIFFTIATVVLFQPAI